MTQKNLFPTDQDFVDSSFVAVARRSDPSTSHEAAAVVNVTGSADSQRSLCLQFLIARPGGWTAAEIAAELGQDRHTPSRRLPELRATGHVVNGPARLCRVQKSRSLTWEAAR